MGRNAIIECLNCHLIKETEARGLCRACYFKEYYAKNKELISQKAKKRYRSGGKEEWETYYTINRERIVERQRQYREKNKAIINAKQNINYYRYKYGLSIEDVDKLIHDQENKCLGCQEEFTEILYPCVDHCHTTNKVRGILCNPCNMSLGILKDSPATLRRLADYLEVIR